jgi:hypothetical protein
MDLLLAVWQSLRAHSLRFALTSLGIVWGSFMLTYLSATAEGTERHFERVMQKAGPKIVYMGGGAILKQRVGERGARIVELEVEDSQRVGEILLVEDASPMIDLWNEMVRNGSRTKLLNVQGVSASADVMRNFQAETGRFCRWRSSGGRGSRSWEPGRPSACSAPSPRCRAGSRSGAPAFAWWAWRWRRAPRSSTR